LEFELAEQFVTEQPLPALTPAVGVTTFEAPSAVLMVLIDACAAAAFVASFWACRPKSAMVSTPSDVGSST
jgi:hypothetical protein